SGGSKEWERLVPPAVTRIIGQIGGAERIKMLARSDSEPHRW
ncbi:MAG: nicotinamide-nucleotide adenylyltransferase, partial [Nitrososphaera sp.]